MYITRKEFAQMVRDGSAIGKTVVTKNFEEELPVTYEFLGMQGTALKYYLTNKNIYPLLDGRTFDREEFYYDADDFAHSLETENEFSENFEYIIVEGEDSEPDWKI
jgi:hypothetical protein